MISRELSLAERDRRLELYAPLVPAIAQRLRLQVPRADVDELVGVALLALIEIVAGVDEEHYTQAQCVVWVKARVRGVMLRYAAAEARRQGDELLDRHAPAQTNEPLDGLALSQALAVLPPDELSVLEAWLEGYTAPETGSRIGRSTRWVEAKLASGRTRLTFFAEFGLQDAIDKQIVAKPTAKAKTTSSSPTSPTELTALVDEFGTLDALKRSWEPQLRRHAELAATLRERAAESPPDQPVQFRGQRFNVILSPQEIRRSIKDMAGIFVTIGQERFLALCGFTLDKLDLLLTPAQRNKFLTSGRTGPRALMVAPVE